MKHFSSLGVLVEIQDTARPQEAINMQYISLFYHS
jgi:hypothetical protein